jgi:dihydroneopterin triphosphate diphosphatase
VKEPLGPVVQECVEGFLYAAPPLELLLFRRPRSRGRIWVPISGKVESGDADFEAALRRELQEETGLLQPRRVVALDWHVPFRADNGETWRLHAYGVEIERGFEPRLSPEHEAFGWFSLEEAERHLHYPDNQEAARRLARQIGATSQNA